jgi:hypothetical protein
MRLKIRNGGSLVWSCSDGSITGQDAGVNQVMRHNGANTTSITTAGQINCDIEYTLSGINYSSTIPVDIAIGDTVNDCRDKIIIQLLTIPDLADTFIIEADNTTLGDIKFTYKEKLTNDTSFSFETSTATAVGFIGSASNTQVTAGVYPNEAYRLDGAPWDATDFQGSPLPSTTNHLSRLVKTIKGAGSYYRSSGVFQSELEAGKVDLVTAPYTDFWALVLTFEAIADTEVIIDFHGYDQNI